MKYKIGQRVKFLSREEFIQAKKSINADLSIGKQEKLQEEIGIINRCLGSNSHGEYYDIYIRRDNKIYRVINLRFKKDNRIKLKDNLFEL